MRKVKNAFLILLAALLVAAGGLLPMAAARLQDKATIGTAKYEDIEVLQLKMEEEPGLSFYEKIQLITAGIGVEVTDETMKMTGAQVLEAVYAGLQAYVDIGFLVEDLSNDYLEFYPIMVYDENDPSVFNYYWHVSMSLDVSQNDFISLILDDETGKILAIELKDPEMYIEAPYLTELEYQISSVYFNDLEIVPAAEMPVDAEGILDGYANELQEPGDSHVLIRYQCVDVRYGEINIEICVHSNGFYIFPA